MTEPVTVPAWLLAMLGLSAVAQETFRTVVRNYGKLGSN